MFLAKTNSKQPLLLHSGLSSDIVLVIHAGRIKDYSK